MTSTLHQEILESRMIRRVNQIRGISVDDLAQRFFSHMLAVAILHYEDRDRCTEYVDRVMTFPMWDKFQTALPDLYNLIVLVLNQHGYAHLMFNNWDITVPELRLRRILRKMAAGQLDINDFDGFMIVMQRKIPSLRSLQIQLRRRVASWPKLEKSERVAAIHQLIRDMRESGQQSDLWVALRMLPGIS